MGLGNSVVSGYVRWPIHPGQRSLATWLARKLLPERGMLIRLKDESRLWLSPTNAQDFAAIRHLEAAPKLAAFLIANVKPGQLALTTGVGNGLTSIRLSRLVGAEGKVIGVEPSPAALLRARENILANELPDNISLIAGRLGAQAAIVAHKPAMNGKASNTRGAIHALTESVPELLYRLGLRRADLLLLDDTAPAPEILQGITPASRPRILLAKGVASGEAEPLNKRLTELGYRVFNLAGQTMDENTRSASDYLVATDREDVSWLKTES